MIPAAGFVYAAAGRAPDRAPEPMLRPAGAPEAAGFDAAREAFPTTEQLLEANRIAAAEAFSGYVPRMMLVLAASLVMAIFAVLLVVRLHELDTRLAGCVS